MDIELEVSEREHTDRGYDREQTRNTASKYDFVKVKIYLGENLHHYYILSRYLISRMLTVTMIPNTKAVKIALEVKKHLVDHGLFDVSQEQLEAILFKLMHSRGFGNEFVKRYKMVTEFFQQRRPLIILICGVICTGKSTIAQQLASRLNLPNVLQTDIIYELLHRQDEEGPLHEEPLWKREDLDEGRLLGEYQRECRVVRKGVNGDLVKCIRDGKSIIMEGLHLDPGLYLYEFGRYGLQHLQETMNATHACSELALSPRSLTAETEAGRDAPSADKAVDPDHRAVAASTSEGDAGAQAEKLDAASYGGTSRNGESDQDAASVRAAWKARRYSSSASFMLSSSHSSMQPRITSGSDAELAALPSSLKTSTQEVAGARYAPPSPAKFASSPAAEWLAKMEAASSIFHLHQGRSPHSTVDSSQDLPQGPKLSRRKFGKLPSAPAWLSRSRQLFRTAKEPAAAKALEDSKNAKDAPEARRANGAVVDVVEAAGGLEAAPTSSCGSEEEYRKSANAGQSPLQAATSEQVSGTASQLEETGTLDGQSSAGVLAEAQHDGPLLPPSAFQINGAPDGGDSLPGSLQKIYVSQGQPAAAESPMSHLVFQPHQASAQSSSQKAEMEKKALATSAPGKDPIPGATLQNLERRSHSVRFNLRPSVEKPLPSKLHTRPVGNAVQTESVAANDCGQRDAAAARVSDQAAGNSVKGPEKGLDGGPVFVPIVMSMAEQDHVLLVEEWYSRQQANTGGDKASLGLAGVQTRLQALQKHLCGYAASSVPVVHTDLASMGTTLDKLHSYLLQCIAISMGQA